MFRQKVILDIEPAKQELFWKKDGDELSFGTFFNALNLFAIKHYTDGKRLFINSKFKGEGSVKVVYETKNKTVVLKETALLEKIEIDLSLLGEDGFIYPIYKGDIKLESLSYEVDATERPISTAMIFTTFNRQEFLIPNLYKIAKCEKINKVIIVDNAKNVVLPKDLEKDKFIVIPNENLGGSGGFTRGMLEAKKLGVSHMFISDDDITLIPEIHDKALSLISCLREDVKDSWLGFSMLSNDKPTFQYELGAKWEGVPLRKNTWQDCTDPKTLHRNQHITKYNYSAWWSLIMPISVLDKYDYPIPFFIKFDDVEYGLRRQGEDIILTTGFGVWHEDFDKKHSAYLNYYHYRNGIVTNALHDKHPLRHSLIGFMGKNVKCYLRRRFIELKLLDIAINDYLKGPEFFINQDINGRFNEIREIAKQKVNLFKGLFIMPFVQIHYFNKLLFKYNKAKKLYKKDMHKVMTKEYWEKVFKHD